uniref:Glycosyltransferase n=1 Tax=Platycodon grandiflorus TaxID=94286 RepID=A0A9Y1LBL2_PLAGD|nr:glycosyltransferase GT1 [Platycodon grandiflorus]
MDRENEGSLRVLMLPWLAHGHISPFLELAKRLAKKNFHIYLCSTPINLSSIKRTISQEYSLSIQLVELPLPSLPDLPPQYHTTNGLPPHLMPTLKRAYEMSSPTFSNILKTLLPDLLIYDFNQTWAVDAATSLNIPSVQFSTTGTITASFAMYMLKNPDSENAKYPFPEIYLREYELERMRKAWVESSKVSDSNEGDQLLECASKSCGIILIKSFRELEGKYIDFFSELSGKKIVPVGPLVQESLDDQDEKGEIIQWLDKKDKSSVVFVSFGSEYFLTSEEMEEIAHGLECGNVNFIWVLRFPVGKKISVAEALPKGFLERIGDRGMVVEGWAPQAKILKHSSTGGFVSHCGWSSIMESMKLGIPIIAMPMQLDQPFNARLLEEFGVAMEVVREKDGTLRREEIANVIRKVVVEKSGEGMRAKARQVSESLRKKGDEEVDEVVAELLQICRKYELIGKMSTLR